MTARKETLTLDENWLRGWLTHSQKMSKKLMGDLGEQHQLRKYRTSDDNICRLEKYLQGYRDSSSLLAEYKDAENTWRIFDLLCLYAREIGYSYASKLEEAKWMDLLIKYLELVGTSNDYDLIRIPPNDRLKLIGRLFREKILEMPWFWLLAILYLTNKIVGNKSL